MLSWKMQMVPGGYNWVDVRDVANAAINALEKGRSGERYILSGTWTSVKDLAMTIEKVTGKKITQFMLPSGVAKLGVPFIQAYALITGRDPLYTFDSLEILKIGNRHILNGKAVKELDFQPRIFEDTIRDSIEWYKANAYL